MHRQVREKIIIGITGAKHSGKDTLAEFLIGQFLDLKRTKTGFAGPLKQTLSNLTGYSLDEIERLKNEPESKVRHYLQCLADMVKSKNLRSLVDILNNSITESQAEFFVISDLRFSYEAGWIKGKGGSIIRVFCTGAEELADRDEHNSERDYKIIQYDWSISNNGSLGDLEREARNLATFIKQKYKI